jgi:hypothetical protein
VAQVFCLERTTLLLKSGKVRHQIVYGLSNLSLTQASPQRMLALNRAHWGIENRLHWRRDVTLGEDRCQTRTGAAPGILARLNSAVLSLMDRLGVHNVPRQARFFDAHVEGDGMLSSLVIALFFRMGRPWHVSQEIAQLLGGFLSPLLLALDRLLDKRLVRTLV